MKNYLLIFLIIGLLACNEKKPAQNQAGAEKTIRAEIPAQIAFDTEMNDFGLIKAGEILAFTFVFTNRGETNLILYNAETDCGCLEINVPNKTILPGEKGTVEVVFNSAGMNGKQLKTVEIQSNSKEPKHLIIFAEVENEQIEIKY